MKSERVEHLLKSFEQTPDREPIELPSKAQAGALKFAYEHGGELSVGGATGYKIRRDVVDRLVEKGLISSSPTQQKAKYFLTPAGRALGSNFSQCGEPI